MAREWAPSLGAWPAEGGTRFRVWAPTAAQMEVVVERPGGSPLVAPLEKQADGTFTGLLPGVNAGDRYRYRPDGRGPFPDPASRYQPEGVHGPSEVVDPTGFAWSDVGWKGVEPEDLLIYELHVGTFSPEGTLAGVTERLEALRDLGVTVIELMPLADVAGTRNWGYDGVDLFAPARQYGTPDDLRRLVDRAHALGLGMIVDVVYNHFGPVGNYALAFSPDYLHKEKNSDWAACVNLDGRGSQMVREFFIENALHWVNEYHVDGLRLDATHALHDDSTPHFLAELADRVREGALGRRVLLIAEDSRNLDGLIRDKEQGGWGLDGVWADDFHHELRRLIAGDHEGYYRDYTGTVVDLATTINQGWFYTGQHSEHLGIIRGTDPSGIPPHRFVICLQNHDQVGNRAFGDRLTKTASLPAFRAASALLLGAPQAPLLFMGQEWAASRPFQYFTDHDEELGKLVTEGRRREFRHFQAFSDPEARERIPDPQALSTFEASKLDWSERDREPHASFLRLYRRLLALRREEPALRSSRRDDYEAVALDDRTLLLRRSSEGGATILVLAHFGEGGTVELGAVKGLPEGVRWEVVLTTEDPEFAPQGVRPEVETGGARIRFGGAGAAVLKAFV